MLRLDTCFENPYCSTLYHHALHPPNVSTIETNSEMGPHGVLCLTAKIEMLQGFRIFETTGADSERALTDDSRYNGMTDSCDVSIKPIIPLLSDQNRLKPAQYFYSWERIADVLSR
jgi:hypothetical protein